MRISVRAVREIERRAFDKLRRNPALQQFWQEWQGELEEALGPSTEWRLTRSEVLALLALAETTFERNALQKLLYLAAVPLG